MCKHALAQKSRSSDVLCGERAEAASAAERAEESFSAPRSARGKKGRLAAEYVVKVAVMSALLTALKFALSFIPNVEVVTLLIMVYAAVFGAAYALPAVLVFCAVEVAVYGAGSWVVLYFLYWPLLAVVSCLIFARRRSVIAAVLTAAVMSVLFGVLSACCDTLFVAAGFSGLDLAAYWTAYYVRGLYFDLVHIASNFIVVAVLFVPLCAAGDRIKRGTSRS